MDDILMFAWCTPLKVALPWRKVRKLLKRTPSLLIAVVDATDLDDKLLCQIVH